MDRNTARSLTPDEAKVRLRSVADHMGPVSWVREKPRESIGMAFVAGMLAGKTSKSNEILAKTLISLLLNTAR